MSKKNKKQKQKVTYYDDNSTIVDMSRANRKGVKREPPPPKPNTSAKDKWKTYWNAVKMMIKPMLIVIMILCVLYLIALFIGGNFCA